MEKTAKINRQPYDITCKEFKNIIIIRGFLKINNLEITKEHVDLFLSLRCDSRELLYKKNSLLLERFFILLRNNKSIEFYFFIKLHKIIYKESEATSKDAYTCTVDYFKMLRQEELIYVIKLLEEKNVSENNENIEKVLMHGKSLDCSDLKSLHFLAEQGKMPVSIHYNYYHVSSLIYYNWYYQTQSPSDSTMPTLKLYEDILFNNSCKLDLKEDYATVPYLENDGQADAEDDAVDVDDVDAVDVDAVAVDDVDVDAVKKPPFLNIGKKLKWYDVYLNVVLGCLNYLDKQLWEPSTKYIVFHYRKKRKFFFFTSNEMSTESRLMLKRDMKYWLVWVFWGNFWLLLYKYYYPSLYKWYTGETYVYPEDRKAEYNWVNRMFGREGYDTQLEIKIHYANVDEWLKESETYFLFYVGLTEFYKFLIELLAEGVYYYWGVLIIVYYIFTGFKLLIKGLTYYLLLNSVREFRAILQIKKDNDHLNAIKTEYRYNMRYFKYDLDLLLKGPWLGIYNYYLKGEETVSHQKKQKDKMEKQTNNTSKENLKKYSNYDLKKLSMEKNLLLQWKKKLQKIESLSPEKEQKEIDVLNADIKELKKKINNLNNNNELYSNYLNHIEKSFSQNCENFLQESWKKNIKVFTSKYQIAPEKESWFKRLWKKKKKVEYYNTRFLDDWWKD